MKHLILALSLLVLTNCAVAPINCPNTYGRRDFLPLRFDLTNSGFSEDEVQAFQRAADTWSMALGQPGAVQIAAHGFLAYYVPVGDSPDQQAATRLKFSDNIIRDLKITYSSDFRGHVDFESLSLHEIGHALGLDHVNGSGVMNPSLGAYQIRRVLDESSITTVQCLYK